MATEAAAQIQAQQEQQQALRDGTFDRLSFEPESLLIPASTFLMGSANGPKVEQPQHPVTFLAFRIEKYPITNAEYEHFVRATGLIVAPELG